MRVVSCIPNGKAKAFSHSLSQALSGEHSCSKIDKVEQLNRKLKGCAQFYRHTDYTAKVTAKLIVLFSGNSLSGWLGNIVALLNR
jgi:RNA-directed DNA polymerase